MKRLVQALVLALASLVAASACAFSGGAWSAAARRPWNPRDAGSTIFWGSGDNVTLTSAKVSTWNDMSGNGNNATQSTAGNRPTTGTAIGGLPTIHFDGSASYLTWGTSLGKPANYTIWLVFTTTSVTIRQWAIASEDGPGNGQNAWGVFDLNVTSFNGSVGYFFGDGTHTSSGHTPASTLATNTAVIIAKQYTSGQSAEVIYKNGTSQTITTTATASTTNSGTAFEMDIGRSGANASLWYSGDVAECVVENASASATTIGQVDKYLEFKYGISGI